MTKTASTLAVEHWKDILQLVLWAFSCFGFGLFLFPEIIISSDPPEGASVVARLTAFVIVGALMIPLVRYQRRSHMQAWLIFSFIIAIAFIAIVQVYFNRLSACTKENEQMIYLIGDDADFTDAAKEYAASGLCGTPCDAVRLLSSYENDPAQVWREEALTFRYNLLFGLYILTLVLGGVLIVSVVQTIACLTPKS